LPPSRQPSWSWVDLRSDPVPSYRRVRFADPPSASHRPLGFSERAGGCVRLLDSQTSLPWPSPLLQGFHPRLPCRVAPAGVARSTPLVGFIALQHLPDPRVHLREVSTPRYVPPSGFPPSRRFTPRKPSRPCFRSERSWAFALQGVSPPGPPVPLARPVTSSTLAACRRRLPRQSGTLSSSCVPRARPRGFSSLESSPSRRLLPRHRRLVPLLGFPSLRFSRLPSRRFDLRPSPPGLPDGVRARALQPPRPSGVFDDEGPGPTPRAGRPLRGSFPLL